MAQASLTGRDREGSEEGPTQGGVLENIFSLILEFRQPKGNSRPRGGMRDSEAKPETQCEDERAMGKAGRTSQEK